MPGVHAPIAPSKLALTIACQAWIQLSKDLPPEPEGHEAQEGTAADWVRQQYVAGNEVAYGTPIPTPGGFKVDYDMIHGAKLWVDVIGYGAISNVPVVCSRIHPSACWGEPDGWTWSPIAQRLKLPEYKYGFGVHDVFEHWQSIAYVAGLLETLGLNDTEVTVEFIIVQPRAPHKDGPVRRWVVKAEYLRALINEAWNKTARAWPTPDHGEGGPPAVATTGSHCKQCPARYVCETFIYETSRAVEYIGNMNSVALNETSVGVELSILESAEALLEGRLTALRAQAEGYLRAGKRVPNYCMEPQGGGFRWNEDVTVQELDAVAATCGITLRNNITDPHSRKSPVVTPLQAIKAGIDESVINSYASKLPGAMKLTRESKTDARRAFGVFANE